MCDTYGLSSVLADKDELERNFLECCEPEEDVDSTTATELWEMQFDTSEEIDIDMNNISEEDSSHNSNNLAAVLIFGTTKTQISEPPKLEHLAELFEEYNLGTLKSYDILEENSNDCLLQLKNSLETCMIAEPVNCGYNILI